MDANVYANAVTSCEGHYTPEFGEKCWQCGKPRSSHVAKSTEARDLFVVFDGPPSHESGRFVELEDANGAGVGGVAEWKQREDGYWTLGPFRGVPSADEAEGPLQAAFVEGWKDAWRRALGRDFRPGVDPEPPAGQERCSYCGELFPKPVELHHHESECHRRVQSALELLTALEGPFSTSDGSDDPVRASAQAAFRAWRAAETAVQS